MAGNMAAQFMQTTLRQGLVFAVIWLFVSLHAFGSLGTVGQGIDVILAVALIGFGVWKFIHAGSRLNNMWSSLYNLVAGLFGVSGGLEILYLQNTVGAWFVWIPGLSLGAFLLLTLLVSFTGSRLMANY